MNINHRMITRTNMFGNLNQRFLNQEMKTLPIDRSIHYRTGPSVKMTGREIWDILWECALNQIMEKHVFYFLHSKASCSFYSFDLKNTK